MSAGLISMILTILFVLILISGFFIGFWRGVKRASVNFGLAIVAFIVSFFACGPLTRALLGIQVGGKTLNSAIVDLLKQNADIGHLIETTPSLNGFINNLPYAIANILIFILFASLTQFIMYLIYKIIVAIAFKKRDKEGNKIPRKRLAGGLVGLAKTFIFSLLVIAPLTSIVGTVSYVDKEFSKEKPLLPTQVSQGINGYNSSAFGVLGNLFGLDDVMFDYLSAFKIDKETIKIREEIVDYISIYDTVGKFQVIINGNNGEKLENIDFKSIDRSLDKILNSGFYKTVISNVAKNLIVDRQSYSFMPKDGDIERILADVGQSLQDKDASEYLGNDIRALYEGFKVLAKSGALDGESAKDILRNLGATNADQTKHALNSLFNMNILRDSISSIFDIAFSKIKFDDISDIVIDSSEIDDSKWDNLGDCIIKIISGFSDLPDIDINGVLNDPLSLLEKDETVITSALTSIGNIIDGINECEILKQDGKSIISDFLTNKNISLPTEKVKDAKGVEIEIKDYSSLMEFMSKPLIELKNSGAGELLRAEELSALNIFECFANALAEDNQKLNKIILPLLQVNPTKTIILDKFGQIGSGLLDFNALIGENDAQTYSNYEKDLKYISKILIALNQDFSSGEKYLKLILNDSTDDFIKVMDEKLTDELLPSILYAKSTATIKKNLFDYVASVMTKITSTSVSLNVDGVTFIENDENDQAIEIVGIFKNFIAINKIYKEGDGIKQLGQSYGMSNLGTFFSLLQANAYRTREEFGSKQVEGLFAGCFNALVNKLKTEYSLGDEIGTDYAKIDFNDLFDKLEKQGA